MAGARQHRAEEGAFARPTKGGAMRTRIALVAIIPIALITVSTLAQAAPVQSGQAVQKSSAGTKPASSTAKPDGNTPLLASPSLLVDLVAAPSVAPHTPPPVPAAPAAVA